MALHKFSYMTFLDFGESQPNQSFISYKNSIISSVHNDNNRQYATMQVK